MNEIILYTNLGLSALILMVLSYSRLFKNKQKSSRTVIVDSCGLIDGRITELAGAGFVPEKIIVPSFVLKELQLLADGNDSHKRERARFGLDKVKELQELARVDVEIDRSAYANLVQTDDKLIAMARDYKAQLYTIDFNLSKVAEVEGVGVLNVNELAQKLRPNYLPGEKLKVKVIQRGSGQGQGVGYTDDGTMIVVDGASKMIGKTLDVTVDRMLNTMAGKMIFATKNNSRQAQTSVRETEYITSLPK